MDKKITIKQADVLTALKEYPDNYFHGFLADPPYEINFMSKGWDGKGIAFNVDMWKEVYRVLKPGAFLLAYGGTRTYHRMVCAIEDAGFEIRDCFCWLYSQGFPKSLDISKAIDKLAGAEREVIGTKLGQPGYSLSENKADRERYGQFINSESECAITAPTTAEAKLWDGYGTATKPAWEPVIQAQKPFRVVPTNEQDTRPDFKPIVLAMKPLAEKTYAENVLRWGTGGLNIDGGRIGTEILPEIKAGQSKIGTFERKNMITPERSGRWPANLLLTHHPDCVMIGTEKIPGHKGYPNGPGGKSMHYASDKTSEEVRPNAWEGKADENGEETIEQWDCHPDCPIKQLNESVGIKKSGNLTVEQSNGFKGSVNAFGSAKHRGGGSYQSNEGYVSRFFYNGKVSRKERELPTHKDDVSSGLESIIIKPKTVEYAGRDTRCSVCHKFFLSGSDPCVCSEEEFGPKSERMENPEFHNNHPTLKSIQVNQYLANLIRPPYGAEPLRLLNCFGGTCSEAIGAYFAGWQEIVVIEKEIEYTNIGQARVDYWTQFHSYEAGIGAGNLPSRKKKENEMPTIF